MALRYRFSQALINRMMRASRFPPLPVTVVEQVRGSDRKSAPALYSNAHGVNLFGYFRGQFGLAEAARSYAKALMDAGYPVALVDIDIDLPHGFDEQCLGSDLGEDAPYLTSVIFVNPDFLTTALERIGAARLQGRYLIACWFWELERVPDEWLPAVEQVDEIMVASNFVEEAFRAATGKPVLKVPLPLPDARDSGVQRRDFGLPEEDFIFLTSFDFHSWVQRKNPAAVVEAFLRAFPDPSCKVKLLVKTSNGARHPQAFAELLGAARREPRIMVRDGILDSRHMTALQRCCDAYVSLHRAEGFGLGMAECMSLGKPVVATGWSGNMEFMTGENSCLVGYRLIDVQPDGYLHSAGQRWADPDTSEASNWMQRLVADPSLARRIGNRAIKEVSVALSGRRAAARMIERLEQIAENATGKPASKRIGMTRQRTSP
ncbi:MAG TPA: glycosyltransferase family 4 protein [Pseudoxanthomonas sp.]|nr:glycosyltransferase family 4 protein [Pseudoxanthomonas sp.]